MGPGEEAGFSKFSLPQVARDGEGDGSGPEHSGIFAVFGTRDVSTRGIEKVEPAPTAALLSDGPGRMLPEVVGRVSGRCR